MLIETKVALAGDPEMNTFLFPYFLAIKKNTDHLSLVPTVTELGYLLFDFLANITLHCSLAERTTCCENLFLHTLKYKQKKTNKETESGERLLIVLMKEKQTRTCTQVAWISLQNNDAYMSY